MARYYSKTVSMNLDAKNTAFPADVKKVMLGETPTKKDMWLSPEMDNINGLDKNSRNILSKITSNRD
jgi:hypothetical protein